MRTHWVISSSGWGLRRFVDAGFQPESREVAMTTTVASSDIVASVEPLFSEPERIALAGS
jgi:hypothetical protein